MPGLPNGLRFLVGLPSVSGADAPDPPLFPPELDCGPGSDSLVLEPARFTPDSHDWYGGIEQIGDPSVPGDESYVGSTAVGSFLGVEFPIPQGWAGGSGIYVSLKSVDASAAEVTLVVQYYNSDDNLWHDSVAFVVVVTGSYALVYIDDILSGLPFDEEMVGIRLTLVPTLITSLDSKVGEVRLTHLTIPYCSPIPVSPPVGPPPPLPPLGVPPQSPDVGDTLPPLFVPGPPLPPLPPSGVVSPPLPPGSEILRPNRDIFVALWQPRPAYMQLNDALDVNDPVEVVSPLYGPASVEVFDEATGNYLRTSRPRVEVGFTVPVEDGPWEALQLRFRAARSRPPQPEVFAPPLPLPLVKPPASRECPPSQFVYPRSTDFPGVWQNPPLEKELADSVDKPVNTCFISAPVEDQPGLPAQIALTSLGIEWFEGWEKIKVRLVARVRAAKETVSSRKINGITGRVVQFDPFHAGLPSGGPNYQVRWNPFDCANNIHAFQFSPTEIRGTGILQTNLDISADFFLDSQDSDHLLVEVGTDGVSYYDSIRFDLGAFKSTVIYYRVVLNRGGEASPAGNLSIAMGLRISGPYVVTGIDLATHPRESSPFIISVAQGVFSDIPLVSQCRVGVALEGNMALIDEPKQYTDTLIKDWAQCAVSWRGFWSKDEIKDLRVRLFAEALDLLDDVPFIDISAMDVEVSPYCPGLSQPLTVPLISLRQVDILPVSDVLVLGWSPTPCWSMLVADPTLVAQHYITVGSQSVNQVVVKMGAPAGIPALSPALERRWIRVEAVIQAKVQTFGSEKVQLFVSTNFGQEKPTDILTTGSQMYFVSWDYEPGLQTDQIDRLKVALIARESIDAIEGTGFDTCQVLVSSVVLRLTFSDVPISGSSPPLPPPPVGGSDIDIQEVYGEVFSCGSLGQCAGPGVGRLIGKVSVTNDDATSATVNFIATEGLSLRISDAVGGSYSLSQTMAPHQTILFWIYGWVGNATDSFPVESLDDEILISLVQAGGVSRGSLPWFYIGL